MRRGIFHPVELQKARPASTLVPHCGACGLHERCLSPKMPVTGQGQKGILLVGEAPGRNEDQQGRQFVGDSGKLLEEALWECRIDMRRDCWITNAVICRPPGNNLPPLAVQHCRANIIQTIERLKPHTIILLGRAAVQSVIGWIWKEDPGPISRWVGWQIPCKQVNAWICPTYHPSFLLRQMGSGRQRGPDVAAALFQQHLQRAVAHTERPYAEVPDREVCLTRTLDPDVVRERLEQYRADQRPIAFDYENDRLKPDHPEARILSCAVSDGVTAVAYPWDGDTIVATQELLHSGIPVIGWNLQHEERWTQRLFGKGVANWIWDGMLTAHILDNRRGVCGLKFQSFVGLGELSYDDALKPYMKSKNSNDPNRLTTVPLARLLLYNAKDALFTHLIAQQQMQALGTSIDAYHLP